MTEPEQSAHRPDHGTAEPATAGPVDDRAHPPTPGAVPGSSRRDFLRRSVVGGAGLVGLGALGHPLAHAMGFDHGDAPEGAGARAGAAGHTGHAGHVGDAYPDGRGIVGDAAVAANYGHGVAPPIGLPADLLDDVTLPPPPGEEPPGTVREHVLDVVETQLEVAGGVVTEAWTYGGRAPGPVLRATEGDILRVTVRNRTGRPHNLHLHGRHHPSMDGWEPIPPGGEFTYEVDAAPFGVHPYHCHTPPLAMHVGMGLYGALVVDPPGGRPPAHEVVLVLSGWDLDGDGRNELMAFNGVAGWFQRHPITVAVGELVRVYVLNMTEHEPIASFHLHAQTFDVYWHGTSTTPDLHADTIALTQGDRAIVEFTLPERGRYMFHPHQHHLADAGAMGWFAAV